MYENSKNILALKNIESFHKYRLTAFSCATCVNIVHQFPRARAKLSLTFLIFKDLLSRLASCLATRTFSLW